MMIEVGYAVMIGFVSFIAGLFLGAVVLGMAAAASREDDSRGRDN